MALIAARARQAAGHADAEPVVILQAGAIGAHVADAAVGVLRHAERRGEIGRGVEARRRDRHRQRCEAMLGGFQGVAAHDDFLTRRIVDHHRRNRMIDAIRPDIADLVDRHAHADGIDFR